MLPKHLKNLSRHDKDLLILKLIEVRDRNYKIITQLKEKIRKQGFLIQDLLNTRKWQLNALKKRGLIIEEKEKEIDRINEELNVFLQIEKKIKSKSYRNLRFYLLEKHNYTCQNCKKNLKDESWKLELHHKDQNHLNNNKNNLMLLCNICHHKKKYHSNNN